MSRWEDPSAPAPLPLSNAQIKARANYADLIKRRRALLDAALKPGDAIVIPDGAYRGLTARFIDLGEVCRDWMPWFEVEMPNGKKRKQRFGPVTVMKVLGIKDE